MGLYGQLESAEKLELNVFQLYPQKQVVCTLSRLYFTNVKTSNYATVEIH